MRGAHYKETLVRLTFVRSFRYTWLRSPQSRSLSKKLVGVSCRNTSTEYLPDLIVSPHSRRRGMIHPDADALWMAVYLGQEKRVGSLLAEGYTMPPSRAYNKDVCPLMTAVKMESLDMVCLLLESGMGKFNIPPSAILPPVMAAAIHGRLPRILNLLLTVDGAERAKDWANFSAGGCPMLHYAGVRGNAATIGVLLRNGADETVVDRNGVTASVAVGTQMPGTGKRGAVEVAAMRRVLERGPAFRARSWWWPARSAALLRAGRDESVGLRSSAARPATASLGVKIYRPPNPERFLRLIHR